MSLTYVRINLKEWTGNLSGRQKGSYVKSLLKEDIKTYVTSISRQRVSTNTTAEDGYDKTKHISTSELKNTQDIHIVKLAATKTDTARGLGRGHVSRIPES